MKNLSVLILFSVLVFGCTSGDNVIEDLTPKTLFTYTSNFSNGDGSEIWIILRDSETGELIEAKQAKKNVALVFDSAVTVSNDKLSITELIVSESGKFVQAGVYNGIAVGSVWTEKSGSRNGKTIGAVVGYYTLNITDLPEIYNYALTNGIDDISYYLDSDEGTLTSNTSIPVGNNSKKHMITVYPSTGNPKYYVLDNPSGDVEISYDNFSSFDKNLNVTFPEGNTPTGEIRTLDSDGNYGFSMFSSYGFIALPNDLTEANFGFLNDYTNYYVNLNFGEFSFTSWGGPPPTSIDFVDGSKFTINNNSIDKFSATTSHPYSFRAIRYIYDAPDADIDVDITYYDPSPGAQHHNAFTPELISKYSIPMADVKFTNASFIVGGLTYEEWQKYFFVDDDFTKPFAIASVTKQ